MFDIPKDLIIDKSKCKPPIQQEKSTREIALEDCCENYEQAMKESQAIIKSLEKEVKQVNSKFNKLVKIVTHNVKKPNAILNQI